MPALKTTHRFTPLAPFSATPTHLALSASGPFSCFLRHHWMIAIAVVLPPAGFGVEMSFRQLPEVRLVGTDKITAAEVWECTQQELSRWADAYERGGRYEWVKS